MEQPDGLRRSSQSVLGLADVDQQQRLTTTIAGLSREAEGLEPHGERGLDLSVVLMDGPEVVQREDEPEEVILLPAKFESSWFKRTPSAYTRQPTTRTSSSGTTHCLGSPRVPRL